MNPTQIRALSFPKLRILQDNCERMLKGDNPQRARLMKTIRTINAVRDERIQIGTAKIEARIRAARA